MTTEPDKTSRSGPIVVGVGASAGGLESLQRLFGAMPSDTGMAFVVIQHLDPNHKSLMRELLGKHMHMPVCPAEHGDQVEANTIYLIQPRTNLEIREYRLQLTERMDAPSRPNFPIDQFFRSMAHDCGERSVAIVLSGTGSDGAAGVQAVRAAGGVVFVEDPNFAQFDGMPRAAIQSGAVNMVLPAQDIPTELTRLGGVMEVTPSKEGLERVLAEVGSEFNINFVEYKPAMVVRRVERRRLTTQCESLDDYAQLLSVSNDERRTLGRDLLVGVTKFFRDPDVFSSIEELIPDVLDAAPAGDDGAFRVWVPACSTGEEAYTLAIIICEAFEKLERPLNVKIFASDVNGEALDVAARALYPLSIEPDLRPEWVEKYFVRRPSGFEVRNRVREMVVFAKHNLLRDPPFTRVGLISCRNFLIYLRPPAQARAIAVFEFALRNGGYLLLGSAESLGAAASRFRVVDGHSRIFAMPPAHDQSRPALLEFASPRLVPATRGNEERFGRPFAPDAPPEPGVVALASLLTWIAQPIVVVNHRDEAMYVFGEASELLSVPSGRVGWNLPDLLPPGLGVVVGSAVTRARDEGKEIRLSSVSFELRGEVKDVSLRVVPFGRRKNETTVAVMFEGLVTRTDEGEFQTVEIEDVVRDRVRQLEVELDAARDRLQETVEKLEASNEELQATNEELTSSNEELQSTNEELQSLNEELHTVNAELQAKVQEYSELNDDLSNLLRSVDAGILFLDLQGRIRRFNEHISDVIRIRDQDVGRPIGELAHQMVGVDLEGDAFRVVASVAGIEKQVQLEDRRTVMVRMYPFRTREGRIEGVVVHTTDVTALAVANRELEVYSRIAEQSPAMHVVTDRHGHIESINAAFCRATGWRSDQLQGVDIRSFLAAKNGPMIGKQVRDALGNAAPWRGHIWFKTADAEAIEVYVDVFPVRRPNGDTTHLVVAGERYEGAPRMEELLKNGETVAPT